MNSGLPSLPASAFLIYFSFVCIFQPQILSTLSVGSWPSVRASAVPADAELPPGEDALLLSSFPAAAASSRSRTEAPSSLAVVDSSESGGKKSFKCQHFTHPRPPGDKDGRLQSPPLHLRVHLHPQVLSPSLSFFQTTCLRIRMHTEKVCLESLT